MTCVIPPAALILGDLLHMDYQEAVSMDIRIPRTHALSTYTAKNSGDVQKEKSFCLCKNTVKAILSALKSAEGGIRTRAPETGLKHFECLLLDHLSTSAGVMDKRCSHVKH